MSDTQTKEDVLNNLFRLSSYSWMSRLFERWRSRLYFTDLGKARLANIAGYLVGLSHAGQTELAEALAESLVVNLDRLAGIENEKITQEMTFNVTDPCSDEVINETFQVIPQKVILADDGTWGGFSVLWLYAVNPDKYRKVYRQYMLEHEDDHSFSSPANKSREELRIKERLDDNHRYSDEITSYVFSKELGKTFPIYYSAAYNGGLLYHGPGAGETFSVTLNKCYWSVHT